MIELTKDQAVLQDVAMRCASLIVDIATLRADLSEARRQLAAGNGEGPGELTAEDFADLATAEGDPISS